MQASNEAFPAAYRFDDFELQLNPRNLTHQQEPVLLQPQPIRLLELLVLHRGELVTRDQIRRFLWPDDSFLDHEQAINFAVRKIRIALDDRADAPRFIETVPRQGYRFVARAEPVWEPAPPSRPESQIGFRPSNPGSSSATPEISQAAITPVPLGSSALRTWGALTLVLVIALSFTARGTNHRSEPLVLHIQKPEGSVSSGSPQVGEPVITDELKGEYLQARYWIERGNLDEITQGVAKLRAVIEGAPRFAPAYAALAHGFFNLGRGGKHFATYMPQVRENAELAIKLDPSLPEAHWLRGMALFFHDRDWAEAERTSRRALALRDDYPDALQLLGVVLASQGRFDEALSLLRKAVELDPAGEMVRSDLAYCLMWSRRYAEALKASEDGLELAPDDVFNLFFDASLRTRLGHDTAALASYRAYFRAIDAPEPSSLQEALESLRKQMEHRRKQGRRAHYPLALAHSLLGNDEQALDLLLEACDHDPDWELPFVGVDPRFDGLRQLPRYKLLKPCLPPLSP